jgi:hypothetical protein
VRPRPGWPGLPPPSCGDTSARPGLQCRGGLALVWSSSWASSLLWLLYAFQNAPFLSCFTCFLCMFLQHVKSTSTSGNMLVAKVYVYRSVCFPPFWTYVGGINVSITIANKIPQAYPLLVREEKLRRWLLIRSCYYADYISMMPCL